MRFSISVSFSPQPSSASNPSHQVQKQRQPEGERGNPYRDTDDRPALRACLWEQAQELAGKLARHRLAAGTVQVKVRYGDFTTLTRQLSVEEPLQEAREIYRLGCWLLGREKLVNRPLRLIGLGVSGLREAQAWQLPLVFPA